MKKVTRKIQSYNGVAVRRNVYLPGLLNLNIVRLLNKAKLIGRFGLPQIQCDTLVYPDFLAVYKERGLYTRTRMTGVCFILLTRNLMVKTVYLMLFSIIMRKD